VHGGAASPVTRRTRPAVASSKKPAPSGQEEAGLQNTQNTQKPLTRCETARQYINRISANNGTGKRPAGLWRPAMPRQH
jgi:hypothetical protein